MVRLSGTISQAPKTQKKNGRSSGPPWPLWGQSWGAFQEVLINPNGWMPHRPCQILGPTGRTNPKWRGEMMQNEAKASYRNSQKEASDLYVCKYIIYKYINIYVYIYTLWLSVGPFCPSADAPPSAAHHQATWNYQHSQGATGLAMEVVDVDMGMDQYIKIPFLGGWTSINPS